VGKNKATALKLQLLNFYGRKVNDFPVRLSKDNLDAVPAGYDLLVDGFDNAASRRLVQDYARRHNKPCLHAGLAAEGAYGIVRWDRNFIIDEEDAPGQPTCEGTGFLPIIVRVSSALIRSIQVFLDEGRELNWNIGPENAESF
ncbi:MAG: ThiF family adenylyltransferase, partial [Verrucomicrobiota bacterium]